jgi:hypothetical protein
MLFIYLIKDKMFLNDYYPVPLFFIIEYLG